MALLKAIRNENVAMIKLALAGGMNVHDHIAGTPRYAALHGHVEIVNPILAAGADVHAVDDASLHSAATNGHVNVVHRLLAAGSNVHATNDVALRWASRCDHAEVVAILLAAGANVHANNDAALRWAAADGHTEGVGLLLDAGAGPVAAWSIKAPHQQAMTAKMMDACVDTMTPEQRTALAPLSLLWIGVCRRSVNRSSPKTTPVCAKHSAPARRMHQDPIAPNVPSHDGDSLVSSHVRPMRRVTNKMVHHDKRK